MTIAMQPIYTQTLGSGGASAVTFNNIPQTFTDLKVLTSMRDGRGDAGFSNVNLRFNADTSSVYSNISIAGTGGATSSGTFGTQTAFFYNLYCNGAISTANTFSNNEITIPNYTNSSFKQVLIDSIVASNETVANSHLLVVNAGLFRSTTPISSITFTAQYGVLQQHSTFTLYGITKG
jgi:hypothetical protein